MEPMDARAFFLLCGNVQTWLLIVGVGRVWQWRDSVYAIACLRVTQDWAELFDGLCDILYHDGALATATEAGLDEPPRSIDFFLFGT
jgi:hypothetical protein